MNVPPDSEFAFSDEFRQYRIYVNRWIAYSGALVSLVLVAIVSIGQEGWVVAADVLLVIWFIGAAWWTVRLIGMNSKLFRMRRDELRAFRVRNQS